jgi:ectoine hydroxylase-related dioxygenase (phytanoyl-CoA dioxygenase family)
MGTSAVTHLPADTTTDELAAVLERDGVVVVDRLVGDAFMDRLAEELSPWIDATPHGTDDFGGRRTTRTGGLIARSATARQLVTHPLVLGAVGTVLGHATGHQVHLTQVISIEPGETAQQIHRDQWAFDFFPFPTGYEVQCNTIWAMTDFTEENGATRVIPGSHRWDDRLQLGPDDTVAAEMARGSVLLYTGSLYHGGGANRSDGVRQGVNLTYAVSWLRQEENQYLSVPFDVARELDEPLLRLMGYARGAYALGYVDDLRDPITVLDRQGREAGGFGDDTARPRIGR